MKLILNSCKTPLFLAKNNLKTLNYYNYKWFSSTTPQDDSQPKAKGLEIELEHDKHRMPHASYTEDQVKGVKVTHKTCDGLGDWFAYGFIKTIRSTFDAITGYKKTFPW